MTTKSDQSRYFLFFYEKKSLTEHVFVFRTSALSFGITEIKIYACNLLHRFIHFVTDCKHFYLYICFVQCYSTMMVIKLTNKMICLDQIKLKPYYKKREGARQKLKL